MATFKVESKRLSKVYPHPNADRLELGQVEGMLFQFVIPKDVYKVGETIIYFPVDSLLQQDFIQQQNIANHLAGKDHNRVKTCTLRKELSQGYVASVKSVLEYLKADTLPEDLTAALHVEKYEPPEIMTHTGNLVRLPEHVYYYDIEGCDRYPDILALLMDRKVVITEKLEGSNFGTSINPEGKVSVNQHKYAIENIPDKEEHTFWKVARQECIIDMAQALHFLYPNQTVTIRGEVLGPKIQGNYYNLTKHTVRVYDVEIDGRAVDYPKINDVVVRAGQINDLEDAHGNVSVVKNWNRLFVPIIAENVVLREWLGDRTIQQASNGKSALIEQNPGHVFIPNKIREGIVIKPMEEEFIHGFGRLFLKQRDPIYLDKTGN
jgi:RNA ligase (TIGR02306 family)